MTDFPQKFNPPVKRGGEKEIKNDHRDLHDTFEGKLGGIPYIVMLEMGVS